MAVKIVLKHGISAKGYGHRMARVQDKNPSQVPIWQALFFKKNFLASLHLSFELKGCVTWLGFGVGLIAWLPTPVWAIVQHPSQSQILESIAKGQEGAQTRTPPNTLYWRFGSSEENSQPYGFLMTKLSEIAVMSGHFALRGEQPDSQDIQRILDEDSLQVVVIIFGHFSTFAMNSYLILKQGSRLIKPDRIRFDARASPITQHHGAHLFRAKIVASFIYGTFDLQALTTIKIFPGAGGEKTFDLDFSAIP